MRDILRKEKIQARNNLASVERKQFSEQIVEQILLMDAYKKAQNIMIYKSVKGEVDLSALEIAAKQNGKRLFYPLCISKTEMIALETQDAWKKGTYGIMEPIREHSTEIVPDELDMVICPCAVFDESGGRIGMGAGYYDRFLLKCTNACFIAVAFEIQKSQHVPLETWDIKMDFIVTENKIYKMK